MSSKETHRPFSTQFEKVGLVLVLPNESIVNEALRIKSLSDYEHDSLNETLNARPEVNVDSVRNLIESFQMTYGKLKQILENLTNGQISSLPSIHEKDLNEAQELFRELNTIKSQIEEALVKEAKPNPDTGPDEELAVLPTSDDIFTRPISSVPREERVLMSVLETQQPRTAEEAEVLRLLRLYQSGAREVFSNKPLREVESEISRLYDLVGREKWRNKKIRALATEIRDLNVNLVLETKEKRKRLEDAYDRLFLEAQKNLEGREHRFKRDVFRTDNPAPVTDINTSLPINDKTDTVEDNVWPDTEINPTVSVIGPDFSSIPTLKVEDIAHDPLLDRGEFKGIGNEDILSNTPTLTDAIDSFPVTPNTSSVNGSIPDIVPSVAEAGFANTPISSDINAVESSTVEVSPATNNVEAVTHYALEDSLELTPEAFYAKEKERYQNLRDSVYNKRLGLKFYYELDRAEIHIQTIDYVINDAGYTKLVREKKVRQNTEALTKINERLAEGLRELTQESVAIVPEISPELAVSKASELISDQSPSEFENEEPSYLDLVKNDPLMIKTVIPPFEVSRVEEEKTPEAALASSLPPTIPPETTAVFSTPEIPETIPVPLTPVSTDLPPNISNPTASGPLMDAHLDNYQRANRLKDAGLSGPRQIDTIPFKERHKMRDEYAKERTLAIESRSKFKEAEKHYQTKLKEFYENRSLLSRAGGAVRTFFGSQPKLPPELLKLETIYKYTKEQYALQLRDAWVKRAGAFAGNKVLDEAKPNIKKAFGEKFVLEPRYRLLDIQAEALEKVAQNSKFKPIMGHLRKHKTALRWLGFSVAAGTGAAAGSALIAGFNVARWGVATFGGAAVAHDVYRHREKGINQAVTNLSLEKEKVEKEFTLAKLNEFDESLAFSSLEVERAKLKQKVYAVGAAVAVGGAANIGAAAVSNTFSPEVAAPTKVGGIVTNENASNVSVDEAVRLAHEKRIAEIQESVRKINETANDNTRMASQKLGVSYQSPSSIANEVSVNLDITPETLLQMRSVKVPHYSPSGELLSQTSVSNIRLQGISTEAIIESSLPETKVLEIYSLLNQRVNDLLSARPNFSQIELEKLLFNELQNIYGGEDWWDSAKINEVKIGSIVTDIPGVRATVPETPGLRADVSPEHSILPGEAIISGNTLVADNTPTKIETVPLNEKSDILSGKEPITYTRSGDLAIDADTEVHRVPILNAVNNPAEQINTADSLPKEATSGEINFHPLEPIAPSIVPPDPAIYVANGNYTESPDFKAYLISEYGSVSKFNKILLNQALSVEGETYDIFNKWLNEFQSPYEMSLAKMTIDDFREAFGGPDIGNNELEVDASGLPKQYNTEAIREYATANNFNYETVRNWLITLEDLKREFPHQKETTLEDLFARSIIKADLLALKVKGVSV